MKNICENHKQFVETLRKNTQLDEKIYAVIEEVESILSPEEKQKYIDNCKLLDNGEIDKEEFDARFEYSKLSQLINEIDVGFIVIVPVENAKAYLVHDFASDIYEYDNLDEEECFKQAQEYFEEVTSGMSDKEIAFKWARKNRFNIEMLKNNRMCVDTRLPLFYNNY